MRIAAGTRGWVSLINTRIYPALEIAEWPGHIGSWETDSTLIIIGSENIRVGKGLFGAGLLLSSGVAGTMAANGSGLQWATVRNLLMAWVLTLPAAIMLSATLYVLFVNVF